MPLFTVLSTTSRKELQSIRSWWHKLLYALTLLLISGMFIWSGMSVYRTHQYQTLINVLTPMQTQTDALLFSLSRTVVRGDLALAKVATATLAFRRQALKLTEQALVREPLLPGLQQVAMSANQFADDADNLYANFVAYHNMAVLLQRAMQQPVSSRLLDEYQHFATLLLFAQLDGDSTTILNYFAQLEQRSAQWQETEREQVRELIQKIAPLVARKKEYQAMTRALFQNAFSQTLRQLTEQAYRGYQQAMRSAAVSFPLAFMALCLFWLIKLSRKTVLLAAPETTSKVATGCDVTASLTESESSESEPSQASVEFDDEFKTPSSSTARSSLFGLQYMLSCFDDDLESVNMLLRIFAEDHRDDMRKMEAALAQQQWEEAQRCAHSLKGVAGSLAAEQLRAAAQQVEQSLRRHEVPTSVQLGALAQALADTVAAVDAHLAKQPEVGEA